MDKEDQIQEILENSHRLKHLALAERKTGSLLLSRAQLELLHLLFFHEKLSVKQAADYLGVSLSAISQLADPLKNDGFIAREQDQKDRRIVYLSLSIKGKESVKNLRDDLVSGMRAMIGTLSNEDIGKLNAIYKKMVANATRLKNQKERQE
ncbi:MAG TPA: MarR family transcriptional regulator [Candidatus Saccharimonadales bacterium]|nr:MarR family transcriptional regulator [Candidatus Saccharimonadales bacterium]